MKTSEIIGLSLAVFTTSGILVDHYPEGYKQEQIGWHWARFKMQHAQAPQLRVNGAPMTYYRPWENKKED